MSAPRALAALVSPIARTLLGKQAALGALAADWGDIVGADLAERCRPEKLSFPRGRQDGATLHLQIDPAAALEVQHELPRLIERINRFFGHAAVAQIKLRQQPFRRAAKPPPRPLTPAEERDIAERLAAVEDPELRARLEALGRGIYRNTARREG